MVNNDSSAVAKINCTVGLMTPTPGLSQCSKLPSSGGSTSDDVDTSFKSRRVRYADKYVIALMHLITSHYEMHSQGDE
eukprot:g60005.t1